MNTSLRRLLSRAMLVVACALLPARAPAAEAETDAEGPSVSGEIDVVSRYVWRTLAYSDGFVVQPSLTLAGGPVEVGVWANVDPSLSGSERLTEVDYSLEWSLDLGGIEATPSLQFYTYPRLGDANTGELQVELRRGIPGGWGAFARHSSDVFDYPDASFTSVGLDLEWGFAGGGSLSLSSQVGRGSQRFSDAYLPGGPPLSVAGLGASASIPLGRGWAVRPHVDWLEVLNAEARAMLPAHVPLTFGVALGRL